MRTAGSCLSLAFVCLGTLVLSGCSSMSTNSSMGYASNTRTSQDFSSRVNQHIDTREKVVVVDPHVHVWAAYGSDGNLVRAGQASAGSDYCPDLHRPCHTSVGSFRVYSLGTPECKSHIFPIPKGGAPMPYCMYFNSSQALHGVSENEVGDGNFSHGCVRLHVADAEWLRYNFVNVGTRVVVKPY